MATSLAQLDAALASLSGAVTQVSNDITALIAKINAGQDFTNELTTVQSSLSGLQSADASAQAILSPPVASSPSS